MADQQRRESESSCVVESTAHLSDNEVEIEGGSEQSRLLYTVRESPPVHLSVVFALQMALMNVSFCITMALIISGVFCGDDALTAKLTSSTLLLSGIATVVQTVLGLRLPVFQGPNPTFLVPLLNMAVYPEWACPQTSNHTKELQANVTISALSGTSVLSSLERIQQAEGSLVLASLIHVLLGGSGLMGRVMTFIGPLTIAPTIAMIGISLFKPALDLCETSWPVAALTFGIFLAMTAYFGHLWLPVPAWSRKNGCYITRYPYLQIFAILAAFVCGWLLSHVLTVTGAITDDPSRVEFQARSDAKLHTIRDADWFYFSYPGQFGRPSWSAPLVTGMVVCVLLSIVESLGDYVAVSQVCGEPYPPRHALNRGVMVEGLTSVVSGLYGVGHGTTSYSEMTSVIGLTKVASRRVFIVSGLIMVVMGVFGKLGAVLVCIPPPVLGGKMVLALGTLVGMGLSALHCVDISKSRNYVTVGLALFLPIFLPKWVVDNADKIQTGHHELDNTLVALFGNAIFIACFVGFILDNTLPGQRSTFGKSRQHLPTNDNSVYDLPFFRKRWFRHRWIKFVPFLPHYNYDTVVERTSGSPAITDV